MSKFFGICDIFPFQKSICTIQVQMVVFFLLFNKDFCITFAQYEKTQINFLSLSI